MKVEEIETITSDGVPHATATQTAQENDSSLTRQQCTMQATSCASAGDYSEAMAWCSRALTMLYLPTDEGLQDRKHAAAAAVLYLRRAEYAMQLDRVEDALHDAQQALEHATDAQDKQTRRKAVRMKCRVLVSMDQTADALLEWTEHFSMSSPVLDTLAFRQEFGVQDDDPEEDRGAGRYHQALQYLYRRDFGNAISQISKTLDSNKKGKSKNKDPVLFLLRARCRMELKEYEGAVADAERVVTLLPTAVEAYRWLCEALIALNKLPHARKVCKAGLSLAPEDESLLELSERLPKKKEPKKKEAIAPAETDQDEDVAEEEDKQDEESVEQEDPAFEAIRELKRAIKTDERDAHLYTQMAKLRLQLKQYDQAQADASRAIALDATCGDGYVWSCEALYASRRYAKALRVCEQGLRMVADHDAAAGQAKLREWGLKIQAAIMDPPPEVDAVDEIQPKSRVPKAVAARRQERAQRKVDDGQALRLKCYEKAVDLADDRDFGNAVYWLNKAEGYDAAGSDFYAAQIYGLRARCRFELKQYEHVGKDAEKAIALDPRDVESYRWLCLSLKTRGRKDKALAACVAGLAVCPDHKPLLVLQRSLVAGSGIPS